MTGFIINHTWDKGADKVDWTHWWAPSKSMQRWLPWGADKSAILPQIKSFYLSDAFRQSCDRLGVIIDESDLSASGCITFKSSGSGKGTKEMIIDAATSLPIEAIYYMLVVQDKAKLQRICEYIDGVTLDKDQHKSDILKQDLLNMVMTFHNLLGANPKLITQSMIEACIMDSNNYTPEQKQLFMQLLAKKREIIKAIMGLLDKMQLPTQRPAASAKKQIRILCDKGDPESLQKAQAILKSLNADDKVAAQIVDLQYVDPKIKDLIKKEPAAEKHAQLQRDLVEERFSWLLTSVGALENLRRQFMQEKVDHLILVVSAQTNQFVSGLGSALQTPVTLYSADGAIQPAMQHTFVLPKELQVECLVNNPALAQKYPNVCVLPGQSSTDFIPPTLH